MEPTPNPSIERILSGTAIATTVAT